MAVIVAVIFKETLGRLRYTECVPPKVICWTLNAWCRSIRGRGSGRWWVQMPHEWESRTCKRGPRERLPCHCELLQGERPPRRGRRHWAHGGTLASEAVQYSREHTRNLGFHSKFVINSLCDLEKVTCISRSQFARSWCEDVEWGDPVQLQNSVTVYDISCSDRTQETGTNGP